MNDEVVTLLKSLAKRYPKRFRYIKSITGIDKLEIKKLYYIITNVQLLTQDDCDRIVWAIEWDFTIHRWKHAETNEVRYYYSLYKDNKEVRTPSMITFFPVCGTKKETALEALKEIVQRQLEDEPDGDIKRI